jgi:hypothetical protein
MIPANGAPHDLEARDVHRSFDRAAPGARREAKRKCQSWEVKVSIRA